MMCGSTHNDATARGMCYVELSGCCNCRNNNKFLYQQLSTGRFFRSAHIIIMAVFRGMMMVDGETRNNINC